MRRDGALLRGALLAALLAGCGGGDTLDSQDACGVPTTIRVEAVDALEGARLGETDRCAAGGTRIRVVRGMTGAAAVRLVAHELAHAAGFSAHLEDPYCLLYPVILPVLPGPCETELAWVGSVAGPLYLEPTAEVRDDVAAAAAHWNTALGRELFALR